MTPVKDFLDRLTTDPQVKELMKGMKEPANTEEAADQYVAVAAKIGMTLSREQILGFLKAKEGFQQSLTAKAEEQVEKAALSEESLDAVAGGMQHAECGSTFLDDEWCWFSDHCSVVITSYNDVSGLSYEDTHCAEAVLTDGGDTCLNNVFFDDGSYRMEDSFRDSVSSHDLDDSLI